MKKRNQIHSAARPPAEYAASGEGHHSSKLTEDQVRRIRTTKGSIGGLARHFMVSTTTIRQILKRQIWKNL